jgi:4-amino-4-deoxy-L-arabinose transferase-like glycosyltransferase
VRKFWTGVGLGLFAFVLRILFLGKQSLGVDEAFSVFMASHSFPEFMKLIPYDAHPFIFYTFLHFWMMGGDKEAYLRFPSVICGVVNCIFVYLLGKELLGEKRGILAALFWACAVMALKAETNIRMYPYATCFSLISTFWFWKAYSGSLQSIGSSGKNMRSADKNRQSREDSQRSSLKHWLLYYIFATLSLYTHYYTGFIIMGQWIFLLVRKRWREAVWMPLILTLLFSPWAPVFFLQFVHAIDTGMPKATWGNFFYYLGLFLEPRRFFLRIPLFFYFAASFLSLEFLVWGFWVLYKDEKEKGIFLALLFAVPYCVPFFISHFSPRHIFAFRYLILCVPYFFLLFIYGIFSMPKPAAYPVYGILIFLSLFSWVFSLLGHGSSYQIQDWRKAASLIRHHLKKTDLIFVETGMGQYPLWYYLSPYFSVHWIGKMSTYTLFDRANRSSILVYPVTEALLPEVKEEVKKNQKMGGREWLVLCQPLLVDPHLKVRGWILRHQTLLKSYHLGSIVKWDHIHLYWLSSRSDRR